MRPLREIWLLPAIAVAALGAGYGVVKTYAILQEGAAPQGPSSVQPLPLVRSPEPARYAPQDRNKLTKAIQNELARVGCYEGAANGVWGEATRGAMQAFVESVNARLPTDQPDEVLLSLVEGRREKACGADRVEAAANGPGPATVVPLASAPSEPYRVAVTPEPGQASATAASPVAEPTRRKVEVSPEADASAAPPNAAEQTRTSSVLHDVEPLGGDDVRPESRQPAGENADVASNDYSAAATGAVGAAALTGAETARTSRKVARKTGYARRKPKPFKSFARSVQKVLSKLGF